MFFLNVAINMAVGLEISFLHTTTSKLSFPTVKLPGLPCHPVVTLLRPDALKLICEMWTS